MNVKTQEYERIMKEKNEIQTQISSLENTDIIKQYLKLLEKNEELKQIQKSLYKKIKTEEYSSCNHLWVKTIIDYKNLKTKVHYCSCVKCGLDQSVISLINHGQNLLFEQQIMYNFLKENRLDIPNEIDSTIICDFELARALYNKIKENHPNIDDKTIQKYMEIALDNIRKNENNPKETENRIKRLSLKPNFKNWNSHDIVHW